MNITNKYKRHSVDKRVERYYVKTAEVLFIHQLKTY